MGGEPAGLRQRSDRREIQGSFSQADGCRRSRDLGTDSDSCKTFSTCGPHRARRSDVELRFSLQQEGRSIVTIIQDIMQVGVGVPDREKFENFARDLLGISTSRSPDGRVTYLRPDQYSHRVAAYTASE